MLVIHHTQQLSQETFSRKVGHRLHGGNNSIYNQGEACSCVTTVNNEGSGLSTCICSTGDSRVERNSRKDGKKMVQEFEYEGWTDVMINGDKDGQRLCHILLKLSLKLIVNRMSQRRSRELLILK
eukprot:XP_001707958.1 Hypothetical protein GL50803_101811 [Giardia lamblia ATCC 50803]